MVGAALLSLGLGRGGKVVSTWKTGGHRQEGRGGVPAASRQLEGTVGGDPEACAP